MAFLKFIALLGLIATLKAASINVGEDVAEETETLAFRDGLVPTLRNIEKAMVPISDRLNQDEHDITQSSIIPNPRLSLFGDSDDKLQESKEKDYGRLRQLVQTFFKAIIEGIVDIIRKTNSLPKLVYLNCIIFSGLFLGFGPGILMFIGYQIVLIWPTISKIYYTFFAPVHKMIQNSLTAMSPDFIAYFRSLLVQIGSRGFRYILNYIKNMVIT